VVEVLPLRVRVDEPATEAVLLHGAFELVRCCLRVLQGKRGKAAEADGVLVDHRLEEVVDLERIGNGSSANASPHSRQNLAFSGFSCPQIAQFTFGLYPSPACGCDPGE
jgi:hypothetical protein